MQLVIVYSLQKDAFLSTRKAFLFLQERTDSCKAYSQAAAPFNPGPIQDWSEGVTAVS